MNVAKSSFVLRAVSTALLAGVMWSSIGNTPEAVACSKCAGTVGDPCDDGYVSGSTTCAATGPVSCSLSGDCRSA